MRAGVPQKRWVCYSDKQTHKSKKYYSGLIAWWGLPYARGPDSTSYYWERLSCNFITSNISNWASPSSWYCCFWLNTIQAEKKVKLETIARVFPIWITCEVRRRKLQTFLDLPSLTISSLLWSIISYWLENSIPKKSKQELYLAIDCSQWKNLNSR